MSLWCVWKGKVCLIRTVKRNQFGFHIRVLLENLFILQCRRSEHTPIKMPMHSLYIYKSATFPKTGKGIWIRQYKRLPASEKTLCWWTVNWIWKWEKRELQNKMERYHRRIEQSKNQFITWEGLLIKWNCLDGLFIFLLVNYFIWMYLFKEKVCLLYYLCFLNEILFILFLFSMFHIVDFSHCTSKVV